MEEKGVEKWIAACGYNLLFRVQQEENKGRFPICIKDIKEGEMVLLEPPLIALVDEKRKEFVCDYCLFYFKKDISKKMGLYCSKCEDVYYCSEECQKKAEEKYHTKECDFFIELKDLMKNNPNLGKEKKREDLLCLGRLIIRALLLGNNFNEEEQKKYKFSYDDLKLLHSDLKSFPEKKQKMMKEVGQAVHSILIKSKRFKQLKLSEVVELVCKEESNAFGLYYDIKDLNNHLPRNERLFAFGIYPIQSLFNHSCNPNLYKKVHGKSYGFYALHDISKGSELSITYLELHQSNTNQRRTELQNNYGFYCQCLRCEEDNIDDPYARKFLCNSFGCGGLVVKDQKTEMRVCNICGNLQEEDDDY